MRVPFFSPDLLFGIVYVEVSRGLRPGGLGPPVSVGPGVGVAVGVGVGALVGVGVGVGVDGDAVVS